MADTNEKVLISIEIEKPEGAAQIDALTQKITGLQKATADLKKENNELIKAGKENSDQYIENTRQIEVNKQKINEATSSRKNLVNTIIAEEDSIKALNARNAELIKQRNQISTSTEEGRAKIAAINKEIDKNNKAIGENSSALEKQRFNIGNYKSALDGVVPGMSGFISGLEGATASARAFIATPIGLVLAAVAAALAVVSSFFKNTQEGADLLEDSLTTVSTVLDVVTDRLGKFISGLISISKGDFSEGLEKIEQSFSGIGDEIEREVGLALELNKAMRDLEDTEIRAAVNAAETQNQIKQLLLQSKNRTLSEQERIKLLNQAIALEKGLNEEEIKNKTEALRIASQTAAQRLNITKKTAETEIEFGKRVLDEFTKDNAVQADDLRDNVQKALLAISSAQGESIGILEKIQNQKDALADKEVARLEKEKTAREKAEKERQAAAEKEAAELAKQREEIAAAEEEQFQNNLQVLDDQAKQKETKLKENLANELITKQEFQIQEDQLELEALERKKAFLVANGESTVEIENQIATQILAIKEAQAAREKAINDKKMVSDKAVADNEKALTNARIGLLGQLGNFLQTIAGKNKAIAIAAVIVQKAAAIGQIIANTAIANAKAIATFWITGGMPWVAINTAQAVLSIGSVVGEAAQAVSQINAARRGMLIPKMMARGGIARTGGILRGPSHERGGIPFTVNGRYGFEAEGEEAIINKRSTRMFRPLLSRINQLGGGVAFERGGVTRYQTGAIAGTQTRAAAVSADALMRLSRETPQPVIMVSVEDINARQDEVSQQTNKATII